MCVYIYIYIYIYGINKYLDTLSKKKLDMNLIEKDRIKKIKSKQYCNQQEKKKSNRNQSGKP